MSTARPASVFRRSLWRIVIHFSGGLTVIGRWQARGPCILVANHSSHFDTAALLAALPSTAAPVFVAAEKYWSCTRWRRFVSTSLVGVLSVPRFSHGAYPALLADAREALNTGHVVVIYPEGTRSTNGEIGEFHVGPVHLACDCGVPLVPAAIVGTAAVLPKGGKFSPSPMWVHLGEPVDPNGISAAQLRDQVIAMRTRTSAPWGLGTAG